MPSAAAPDPVLQTIGDTLRDRRERLDLSQKEAATEARISARFYRAIENGHAPASRRTYLRIGRVLDMTIEEIDEVTDELFRGAAA